MENALDYSQMRQTYRRDGTTTKQMLAAKPRALFIWCNDALWYPKMLAEQLERDDLRIVPRRVLDRSGYELQGFEFPEIVLDHALVPDKREFESLRHLMLQVRECLA